MRLTGGSPYRKREKNDMDLPTIEDYTSMPNPKDDLDGYTAWEHFGGLAIDQAYDKFVDHPLLYQEDFMFMGGPAFAYYFPVVDRYVREVESKNEFADEAWVLAHCIAIHILDVPSSDKTIGQRLAYLYHFVVRGFRSGPSEAFFTHLSDDPATVALLHEQIIDLCRFVIEGVNKTEVCVKKFPGVTRQALESSWEDMINNASGAILKGLSAQEIDEFRDEVFQTLPVEGNLCLSRKVEKAWTELLEKTLHAQQQS